MEERYMRGVHSIVDDIRRNVFEEVARLGYEDDDLNRVDSIPYKLVPGIEKKDLNQSIYHLMK